MIDCDRRHVCGIYVLVNIWNSKRYIGQSNDILHRYKKHIEALRGNKHSNQHLQFAFNRYAYICEYVFDFYIIEECSKDLLDERETYWIEHFQTMNDLYGYNLKSGGNTKSYYSEESRKKMSLSQIGHPPSPNAIDAARTRLLNLWQQEDYIAKMSEMNRGENNPMYGKTGELSTFYGRSHSEDSKDLVRQAKKLWWSEHGDSFVGEKNPFYGKTHSAGTVQLIAEKNREKWRDPEYRKKYCKPVVQLDLDGNYINRFDSQKESDMSVGSCDAVSAAFRRSQSGTCYAKGYKWMHESCYLAMIGGDVENAS